MKFRSLVSTVLSTSALLAVAACSSAPKSSTPVNSQPVATASNPPAVEEKPAPAQKAATGDKITTCTLGSDKREIEVESDDAGCEVHYTKHDKTTTVASDKSGRGHCDKTVEKMTSKLEAAGYDCK